MSERVHPVALILAVGITTGIIAGSLWLLSRILGPPVSPPPTQGASITLLGDSFSGYSTFRSTEFQKALQEVGIKLTYQDEFDQTKRAALLNQGKTDLYVTTLDQFLKQKPQGKIVGLIDRTVGADAVVLNTKQYPTLKSLLDLKQLIEQQRQQGKQLTLTYAGDTPSEYLALVLTTKFESFKLSDFEVKKVVDASEAWKLLQTSQENVAVAILWEPFVTQARQQGDTVVLSSRDIPTAIVDVIVASNRLINTQPQKISELLEAYYRRIDANVRDPSQLKQQIAEDGKLSGNDALTILQGIDFFTSIKAKDWMSDGTLEKRVNSTAAVLVLSGRMNQVPENAKDLFTSNFIDNAAKNTETLISLVRADNPDLAKRLEGKGKTTHSSPPSPDPTGGKRDPIGNLQVRGEVKFQTGSSELTNEGQQTLTKLAKEIQEFNPQTVAIQVIGHTSKTGSPDYNQKLSKERAEVVVNDLRDRGLKHKIAAEGKGFFQPLSGIAPTDSRQQRTEVRLVRID